MLIAVIVLITVGILASCSRQESVNLRDFSMLGILILVVAFAIFIGIRRLISRQRGEPAEDEMSKSIMRKTAATSFYVSLYLWVALMFLNGSWDLETETVIGRGVVGMAVIFALSWLYYKIRGYKNA
jgi:peptidoglycan/LPS O-acetylase OafA/YrhL